MCSNIDTKLLFYILCSKIVLVVINVIVGGQIKLCFCLGRDDVTVVNEQENGGAFHKTLRNADLRSYL